jgi:thiamine-phosphate pyrophosphorylase
LPLVAIGGIHEHNAASVIAHGADGVAVVRALCAADDPRQAASRLLGAVQAACHGNPSSA